ncbi:phytoene desaturase [Nocardioides sp. ChNu-153]|uniref:phytoene desaturase family protein n=1 Tax=unclassified Nocardioides TaxID=2615069 RepID=UPI002405FEE4|nr:MULTISPECIES: phytoene desaturase family protein [unclassified Nocardioides]MDF9715738.1 phytoene desaturase [Nocardioides sp. ChNu-99]MDN7121843.1 phytoene desaturase [Nocardioides sp. ChNu-153]
MTGAGTGPSSRVVVVGAGVGGLAAAVRLQALGHRVTVLEQAPAVGGKLGVLEADGFVFDTGPSLLTMPHVLEELFAATGAPLRDVLPLERLDVACRYTFPDGTVLDLPGDVAAVPDALDAALGPGRGAQWSAFLDRARRIWDVTHEPFLESPIGVGDMVRLSRRLSHVTTVAPWASLRGLGRRYLHDPRLVVLLDRYATYTGSDPRRAPAALASVPWAEQAWGSWYVPGGLGRIATALVERLVALGGEVETGAEVVEVTTGAGGRADGVVLADGTRRPADVVVANADARQVYERLVRGATARRAATRVRRTTPSLSGLALLLGVEDPPAGTPHHQVFFTEDYDAEFDAVFGRRGRPRPVDRPTVYVAAPDDPTVVPEPGTSAWFVLVNAPPHDPGRGNDWDAPGLADARADAVLDLLAERGTDVRRTLRHRTVLSPADLERRTLTPGGSIYGTSSNGARAAFLRPANASPVPGLFLVGGSSHPGGGLPLVVLSARIVAGLVGPPRR